MPITLPSAYHDLEPRPVWRAFALLNSIPRPSGQEAAVRDAIFELARERGLETRRDERGNACVLVPGRNCAPNAPSVALQAHLDMVCQKRPDVAFDFERDPIVPRREDERIFATGTTLGADNGIGVAYMIALLEDSLDAHPPLELLFTVEEETGLYGAAHLDPSLVSARSLINLDSEEDDEITIGCAGGAGVMLFLPVQREAAAQGDATVHLSVSGLAGGHSGIQIGQPLGNALKIAVGVLEIINQGVSEMRFVSVEGGTAHNAIPRECVAIIRVMSAQLETLYERFEQAKREVEGRWLAQESGLRLALEADDSTEPALPPGRSHDVLCLLRDLPHGVQKMSERWADKVQTSSNLAEIHTRQSEVELGVSNRSFVACDIAELQEHCATLGKNRGARVEERDGYPGWEPRANSPLRDQTAAAFANVTGHLPHIEVVHAGLECGLLSEKLPGLDAVSFGPTIRGAHTPEEWVSIPSVARNWDVLRELLANLARVGS